MLIALFAFQVAPTPASQLKDRESSPINTGQEQVSTLHTSTATAGTLSAASQWMQQLPCSLRGGCEAEASAAGSRADASPLSSDGASEGSASEVDRDAAKGAPKTATTYPNTTGMATFP